MDVTPETDQIHIKKMFYFQKAIKTFKKGVSKRQTAGFKRLYSRIHRESHMVRSNGD